MSAVDPGAPMRSLYHHRLPLALRDELDYKLAPAEWVNVRRIRVKDPWLSPSELPKANNNVLLPFSKECPGF